MRDHADIAFCRWNLKKVTQSKLAAEGVKPVVVLGRAGVGDVTVAQLAVDRPSFIQMVTHTDAGMQHGFNVTAENGLSLGVNVSGIVIHSASAELEVRDPFGLWNLHKVQPQENVSANQIIGGAAEKLSTYGIQKEFEVAAPQA
jgi:hypothetical protein